MIKILINFTCAIIFIASVYAIFFHGILPLIIGRYRSFTIKRRKYDHEFDNIRKKDRK